MASESIAFEWQVVDEVRLGDGLRFPALDPIPGVYRIAVGKEVYLGEAANQGAASVGGGMQIFIQDTQVLNVLS